MGVGGGGEVGLLKAPFLFDLFYDDVKVFCDLIKLANIMLIS